MKIKYNNIILICYGISVFIFTFQQSKIFDQVQEMKSLFKVILLIVCLIPFILEIRANSKYKVRTLVMLLSFTMLLIGNILLNEASIDLMYIAAFMFFGRRIQPEKIFKTYTLSVFATILVTILLWFFGVFDREIVEGHKYLGFEYSTFGPNLFLHACLAFVSWRKDKISILIWIILLSTNMWFYVMTDTTAAFLSVIALFVLYYIFKLKSIKTLIFNSKVLCFILEKFSFFAAAITIIIQFWYNIEYQKTKFIKLNSILSGRLALGKRAFEQYAVSLFGQPILWNTNFTHKTQLRTKYFYVDSSYLQVLLRYGVVMLVILCFFMAIVGKYSIKKRDINLLLALNIFLIHCITDPQLLSFRYNPFLIIVIPVATYVYETIKKRNINSFNLKERKRENETMC